MATTLLTARDLEILAALDRSPLTAVQMLALSETFTTPFTTERRVRERLHVLHRAGRVRRWLYATAGRGALGYYTLSPLGYRLLSAHDDVPASRRAFSPVGVARQFHTVRLADFIVHTAVCAHRAGLAFTGFYRENACCLRVGDECLFPDCAFQLIPPHGMEFSFFVELDNSTERLRSDRAEESWARKLRLYDAFQDLAPKRFRLLVVSTRGGGRLRHILETARSVVRNPQRGLVYGVALDDYRARPDALTAACFRDHLGRRRRLVWQQKPLTATPSEVSAGADADPAWYPSNPANTPVTPV